MAVGEARSSKSGSADAVRFEAARCVLIPAHDDIAILELEGTFHASARRSVGRPRIVVTTADGTATEVRAVKATSAHAGPKPKRWKASFPLARSVSDADGVTYGLAIGRSLVLGLPAPTAQRPAGPLPAKPQDEVEGQTWGAMIVDLSEARRELAETQEDLARAREEIERMRTEAEAEHRATAEAPKRPRVTWLEEVEAEADALNNGAAPHDDPADQDDEHEADDAPLPVLAGQRRTAPPATAEHEAVYEATLKRLQADRRARLRRRRSWGRLLAFVVFLAAAVAIYIVVTGAVGVDLLEII